MSSETLTLICQIILCDPELQAQLEQCIVWDAFVIRMQGIAQEHHLTLDESDLIQAFDAGRRAWFERFL